jgi:Alpha-L-rhamnosidase N-terminal domain
MGKNGKRLSLLLQLHVTYKNGKDVVITTDESWNGNNDGSIRMADILTLRSGCPSPELL